MSRAQELWLSVLILLLAVPVHLIGLFVPAVYRDPVILLPQNFATDLITLAFVLILFVISAVPARTGAPRMRLLWLGILGYLVYAYGMYAVAVRWNRLFLGYLALFGLSFYTLLVGLLATNAQEVGTRFARRAAVRAAAMYLIVIAVIVAALWLAEEVRSTVSGTVPPSVAEYATPTNVVHVFDLAIVLPAMVIAALLLLEDRPWGYVLAAMLLVKATAIGLWVVAMIWFSARAGIATPPLQTLFVVALTLTGVAVTAWFLGARAPGVRSDPAYSAAAGLGTR